MIKYFRFIKNLSCCNECEWQIAIRKINENGMLFEGNLSDFTVLPNSARYWYADPFLFQYNGREYVFAEMYDRKLKIGKIGYAKLCSTRKLKFKKCLDLPYHLSYPCVYEQNGEIYMLPECHQSGRIQRYKCVSFPNKWIKDKIILDQIGNDTTPCEINGNMVYFSTFFSSMDEQINDNLFLIDINNVRELKKNDLTARCAGSIFKHNDKIIRPHQDCKRGYGRRLFFSYIDVLTQEEYKQSEMCCVYAPDDPDENENKVKIKGKVNHKYKGIHTYNFSNEYEVIDLKYYDGRNIYAFIRNLRDYLSYKMHILKKGRNTRQ